MRRKSTEDFIKKSMDFTAPEEVWDKIKNHPKGDRKRLGMPQRRALRLAWFSSVL